MGKPARPLPAGERVTFKRKEYLVEPDGTVHTLYTSRNHMWGTPSYGVSRLEFRKLQDQKSPLATAVRAIPKILAAAKS